MLAICKHSVVQKRRLLLLMQRTLRSRLLSPLMKPATHIFSPATSKTVDSPACIRDKECFRPLFLLPLARLAWSRGKVFAVAMQRP